MRRMEMTKEREARFTRNVKFSFCLSKPSKEMMFLIIEEKSLKGISRTAATPVHYT
jgi:hypothetical protein